MKKYFPLYELWNHDSWNLYANKVLEAGEYILKTDFKWIMNYEIMNYEIYV